ncbi:unnamed protein product [Parnassius apollo]|uniref:(apollo) hypothetical protein n=1 Tax=Parnassius apollo TaxID=110799 RepID=A0A8S3XH72_PARAO|nr:unnamed protein product [Parnassius apollo]
MFAARRRSTKSNRSRKRLKPQAPNLGSIRLWPHGDRPHATVEELKLKIKNIRTTYNRAASKVSKSKNSGAGEDYVHRSQLIWFSIADRFLKPVIEGRNSKDNMGKENEDSAVNRNSDASSYFDELGQESNIAHLQKIKQLSPKKKAERALKMEGPID